MRRRNEPIHDNLTPPEPVDHDAIQAHEDAKAEAALEDAFVADGIIEQPSTKIGFH